MLREILKIFCRCEQFEKKFQCKFADILYLINKICRNEKVKLLYLNTSFYVLPIFVTDTLWHPPSFSLGGLVCLKLGWG